jgi:hypothetical protein
MSRNLAGISTVPAAKGAGDRDLACRRRGDDLGRCSQPALGEGQRAGRADYGAPDMPRLGGHQFADLITREPSREHPRRLLCQLGRDRDKLSWGDPDALHALTFMRRPSTRQEASQVDQPASDGCPIRLPCSRLHNPLVIRGRRSQLRSEGE